ncbi:hypothetical protein AS200_28215 [Streptomyces sp. CdTB01]|nr:hypothetical protein AS200_28215 [Streptomyces sp. CdTB01]
MHVLAPHPELPDEGGPGGGQPALGADRGLGGAGGAGGEVEEQTVLGAGAGRVRHGGRVRGQEAVVLLAVRRQHAHVREFETGEEREMGVLGDDDPALGVQDVAGQFRAATGGVDTGDGVPGEGRGRQPQRVLEGVVEQHAHVRFGAGRQEVGQQGRPGRGTGGELVMGEHPVLAPQAGTVVAPPPGDELRDRAPLRLTGLHGGAR